MQSFLSFIHARLLLKPLPKETTFIIGNESCDLDSAVCSLVYAYFLSWSNKISSPSQTDEEHVFVPMLNIPISELPIKKEVTYFLNKNNIQLESIICRDTINMETFLKESSVKFHLVDHHILTEHQKGLESLVLSILDHRPKDINNWKYNDTVKFDLTANGSCATSVCFEISKNYNGKLFFEENKNAANLLYGAIILDTANFLPAAKRAVPLDFEMAAFLESILGIEDPLSHREQLFSELFKARTDLSSLNSSQLLRRDMKIVNCLPIPGFAMLVKDFLRREDCVEALRQFCLEYTSRTVLLMGLIIIDGKVCRDLAVFSLAESDLHKRIVKLLSNWEQPSLNLVKTSQVFLENCDHFDQNNVEASRKQIVPIIKQLFVMD